MTRRDALSEITVARIPVFLFLRECGYQNNLEKCLGVQAGCCCGRKATARENKMLLTIFVILLVLWLLGLITSYTLGGFIHILLVIALVVLLIQLISGRRPVV